MGFSERFKSLIPEGLGDETIKVIDKSFTPSDAPLERKPTLEEGEVSESGLSIIGDEQKVSISREYDETSEEVAVKPSRPSGIQSFKTWDDLVEDEKPNREVTISQDLKNEALSSSSEEEDRDDDMNSGAKDIEADPSPEDLENDFEVNFYNSEDGDEEVDEELNSDPVEDDSEDSSDVDSIEDADDDEFLTSVNSESSEVTKSVFEPENGSEEVVDRVDDEDDSEDSEHEDDEPELELEDIDETESVQFESIGDYSDENYDLSETEEVSFDPIPEPESTDVDEHYDHDEGDDEDDSEEHLTSSVKLVPIEDAEIEEPRFQTVDEALAFYDLQARPELNVSTVDVDDLTRFDPQMVSPMGYDPAPVDELILLMKDTIDKYESHLRSVEARNDELTKKVLELENERVEVTNEKNRMAVSVAPDEDDFNLTEIVENEDEDDSGPHPQDVISSPSVEDDETDDEDMETTAGVDGEESVDDEVVEDQEITFRKIN